MKIAEIATFANYCGDAIYARQLIEELSKTNEVIVLSERNEFGIPDFQVDGVRSFQSWFRPASSIEEVIGLVKQERPEVIHIQYSHSYDGELKRKELDLLREVSKVAITIHSEPFAISVRDFMSGRIERDTGVRADLHLVHDDGRGDAIAHYESRGVVPVVPVTMGTPYLTNRASNIEAKRALGINENAFVITCNGFYVPEKGQRELIDVFRLVKMKIPNAVLVFAGGEHPHFKESKALLHNLIADSWSWFGKQSVQFIDTHVNENEMRTVLFATDVFALWSQVPLNLYSIAASTHRAAAVGKPIVLYDSFRVADFTDGVNCLKAKDTVDFAQCLIDLLSDPTLYDLISKGIDEFGRQTSWTNVAALHTRYFKDLLDERL